MDALVAYLQVLGRLTDAAYENTAAPEQKPGPEQLTVTEERAWISITARSSPSPRAGASST